MNTIEFVYLDNCYVKRTEWLSKYKKEQTSKGVEDVDIDYYDNDNELPF